MPGDQVNENEKGTGPTHWLTPAMATIIVGALSLGVTSLVALTYTPLRNDTDAIQREMVIIDKRLTSLEAKGLEDKVERLEERINNLHIYMLQVLPPPKAPPSAFGRRGSLEPFRPQL